MQALGPEQLGQSEGNKLAQVHQAASAPVSSLAVSAALVAVGLQADVPGELMDPAGLKGNG